MSTAHQFEPSLQGAGDARVYEFGPFVLDTVQHALLKEGTPVALTPKTYDTLLVLVQNSGRMLSKEILMKTLWPDSFVEESNLTQQVSTIRKALGESPGNPQYIVTIPGRGYRFVAEVRCRAEEKANSNPTESETGASAAGADQGGGQNNAVPNVEHIVPPQGHQGVLKKRDTVLRIAGVVLLAMTILVTLTSIYQRRFHAIVSPTKPRSLAILPLENLKQDPASDFLGFSLADAVITKLNYVSSLTVRPSAAVEQYRNQVINIQKVTADLNVDTLLIGTFIRDGDDLRITYQLVDGKTEEILGRGTIDLKYDKLLRVQDRVAQQIIKGLQLNLSPAEADRIKPDAPVVPLAYEYYLRGVDLHGQHKFPMAIQILEKSVAIDPTYAPAWAYLGASYTSDAAFELGGRDQYRRAQTAYERALAIQPGQLEAQIFLANLFVDTGKVEQAVPLLRDALKTNPNNADVHWELGYAYRFAGMLNESVAECERARQIDPMVKSNGSVLNAYLYLGEYEKFLLSLPPVKDSAFLLFYRGLGEYYLKKWDRAAQDFDHAFDLDPYLYTQIGKALSNSIAHKDQDGLEILRALEKEIGDRGVGDPEALYKVAQAYAVLGDKVSALRVLRSSVEGGFFSYPYLATDPLLDPLRKEPEFAEILNATDRRHRAFKDRFF